MRSGEFDKKVTTKFLPYVLRDLLLADQSLVVSVSFYVISMSAVLSMCVTFFRHIYEQSRCQIYAHLVLRFEHFAFYDTIPRSTNTQ